MSFASVAAVGQWPCLHLTEFPAWGKKEEEHSGQAKTASQLWLPLHPAEEGEAPAARHKQV